MINFYIGLSDKDTHKQVYTYSVYSIMQSIFEKHAILNLTITQAVGVYNGERENFLIVSVTSKLSSTDIIYICNDIKEKLNQQCVLVQIIDDEIRII